MEAIENILNKIKQNLKTIHKLGVRRIGIFGSYVRGEQNKSSDIDLLVEFEDGKKTFDNYMELKFFLQKILGTEVDLVIRETIKPELRNRIEREVIYVSES